MPDIVDRLLDAAEKLDDMTRSEIQVILRQAAIDIRTLRDLVGIRDEIWLEDIKPEGNG